MLACARIGAIHSVVFGGFSSEALAQRIQDASCKLVITTDGAFRGTKIIPMKATVNEALQVCPSVESVIVFEHANIDYQSHIQRDIKWHEAMQ